MLVRRSRSTCFLAFVVMMVLRPLVAFGGGLNLDPSHIILHIYGSDTTSQVGASISCLGDVNHDGYDDIAVSSRNPLGTLIFYGGNPADSTPRSLLKGSSGATAADFDGDGIRDIVTAEWYFYNGNPSGAMYFYRGYLDSVGTTPFDSISPPVPNYAFGTGIQVAYIEGSLEASLLTTTPNAPSGGVISLFRSPLAKKTPDWTFQVDYWHIFAWNFGFIDFNGDGHQDIFVGLRTYRDTLPGKVFIFYGPSFPGAPDRIISAPNSTYPISESEFASSVSNVGDVDGDGWADLAVNYRTQVFIYRCGPEADTASDYLLGNFYAVVARAGDINGDGHNDLIAGVQQTAPYGGIQVYLGGPQWDTHPDGSLGYYDLPPSMLYDIGYRVASAGDFNGDGVDDIMFSSESDEHGDPHPSDVFVVKGGTDIKTGVLISSAIRPADFSLKQNYPNPFNPSTQIRFSLPTRSSVRLAIYNMAGQAVKVLVDEVLSAGSYTVNWDGCEKSGVKVASGVYLYRIEAGSYSESKKMVLLK